ncbi:MAG: patatin-like protein [Acidobacteriota bacterium]|nr:patatin-like protein [Acidobacteriota bacterium]
MRRWIAATAVLFTMRAAALERPPFPGAGGVRELRAGIICYGGVSLAIYMYGTVRELHHLAPASAALECDAGGDPAFCGGVQPLSAFAALPESAKPYYAALVDLWQKDREHVRTRVVIDVISGTSAGGINGIFLAKALAHNRPLDGLRSIWFEQADIRKLATGRPWYVHVAWQLLKKRAALGGDTWLNELNRALDRMDDPSQEPSKKKSGPALPSLLSLDQPLDLVVTATDFYGTERLIEVGDPATVSELRYDHVFRFTAQRGHDGIVTNALRAESDFARKHNVALAFAARASASFPVAFPAISLEQLKTALGNQKLDTATLAEQFFKDRMVDFPGAKAAEFAKHLYLVDGGVLDNYPFAIANRRVSQRSPIVETRRVFLYLEPDPRVPRDPALLGSQDDPKPVEMLLRSKSAIPGAEPIAQDLVEIHQHNERVKRVSDIIRQDERNAQAEWLQRNNGGESVASRVERALGSLDPRRLRDRVSLAAAEDDPAPAIRGMRDAVEKDAASGFGLSEEAYIRLRVQSVLDQLSRVMGRAVCGLGEEYDGPRAALMRQIVMDWAEKEKLTGTNVDRARRTRFLNAFDLGYVRRKLRFVNEWLNAQYAPKEGDVDFHLTRPQLQKAQHAVAAEVDRLSDCVHGTCVPQLQLEAQMAPVRSAICVPADSDPKMQSAAIFATHGAAIDALADALKEKFLAFQEDVLGRLNREFIAQTAEWQDQGAARAVLARYLGFPYWDRVAYPYTAFSGVGDLSYIDIIRLSPNDTHALSCKKAAKLSGKGLGHFGAFFDANGRQKDYVWGRLDGAERLLQVMGLGNERPRLFSLLHAIVDEEKSEAVVSPGNIREMEKCVATPGSC